LNLGFQSKDLFFLRRRGVPHSGFEHGLEFVFRLQHEGVSVDVLSLLILVFLVQDLSTCPHCPISRLNGECCDFGMYDGGSYAVDRTGIKMAMASRSQPHCWSRLRIAASPGGKVPPWAEPSLAVRIKGRQGPG